jgi:hypothetical protein
LNGAFELEEVNNITMIEFLEKHKSRVVSLMLIFSLILVLFSFVAPYILTQPSIKPDFDFTQTGTIGDTLGGIMNPFIALAGILLTFLAFYMQIEANRLQIKIFQDGLNAEKEKKIKDEKLDCYDKLSLLKLDLDSIIKDIEIKSDGLKRFYNDVKENPFKSNILMRTPPFNYTRTADLDRLAIYRGFQHFSKDKEWIKHFSNLYRILDFLSESFQSIYKIFEYNTDESFKEKIQVRDGMIKLLNDLSLVSSNLPQSSQLKSLLNKVLENNAALTPRKHDGKVPLQTDLRAIQTKVLDFFIGDALELSKTESNNYAEIQHLILNAVDIGNRIIRATNHEKETGITAEQVWQSINEGSGEKSSTLQIIVEIKDYIEQLREDNKDILD